MPTISFTVQANGIWRGWDSFTGASFAYQCIDDSTGVTHDSEATTVRLGPQETARGRISFPIMIMAEHLIPESLTLNVAAKRVAAFHPTIQVGFARGLLFGFNATVFDPGASYSVASRTFTTNPITGQAWAPADLMGLEACLQSTIFELGTNDISLLSGTLTYREAILHSEHRYRGEMN